MLRPKSDSTRAMAARSCQGTPQPEPRAARSMVARWSAVSVGTNACQSWAGSSALWVSSVGAGSAVLVGSVASVGPALGTLLGPTDGRSVAPTPGLGLATDALACGAGAGVICDVGTAVRSGIGRTAVGSGVGTTGLGAGTETTVAVGILSGVGTAVAVAVGTTWIVAVGVGLGAARATDGRAAVVSTPSASNNLRRIGSG